MILSYKIFLMILIFYLVDQIDCQNHPLVTVNTPRGTLIGFHIDQGNDTSQAYYGQGDVFLGIPFALPPLGELRYKRPIPLTKYPGSSAYNATYYRPMCIQPGQSTNTSSEDCLYLSIFSPNVSSTSKYPVMVWIHGGGLTIGSGQMGVGQTIRNLVSKGVVVATLEYRMSWLGFFTTFTDDFPPNLGMLDEVLALKFIREEISYFGGDPNRITLFGQSAGGHSISSHSYSPLSQNLFQQAIMESGTVLTCYEDSVGPTKPSYYFAKYACNYTDEMWNSNNFDPLKDCLSKISVEEGTAFAQKALDSTGNHVCWNMVQDNYFLPSNPQSLYKTRPNIPAIIGNCKDEYSWTQMSTVQHNPNLTFYTKENIEGELSGQYKSWWGNKTSAVLKIFEDNYLKNGTTDGDHLAWLQFYVDVDTAAYFTWGSVREIDYYLSNNNPDIYTYEFVLSSNLSDRYGQLLPDWHPVPHGCEVPYVLSFHSDWSDLDKTLANFIQELWANFAKYGKPTLDGSWKPTTSKDPTQLEYFEFNNVSTMKTGFRAADQIVWNQELPKVLGDSPPNLPDNYPVCPRGHQSKIKNTTCYEAFGTPLSWNDAQTSCGTNSYGSLVTIGSAFENSDLLAYVKNSYPSCSTFYVGLFKNENTTNSQWIWTNYDTDTYRNWKNGYPIPDSTANCVILNANDGSWINQACDITQCYICSY